MYWRPNTNEWFTIASVLEVITNHKTANKSKFDWIWKAEAPPKVKNFMWRMISDGLPMNERFAAKTMVSMSLRIAISVIIMGRTPVMCS